MARPSKLQKETEFVHEKPQAPERLTPDQKAIWIKLFDTVAPEWIAPETLPLAEMYCQHVAKSNQLGQIIAAHEAERVASAKMDALAPLPDDLPAFDLKEWFGLHDKLLKALDRENRAASSLATRLRITTQSLRTNDNSPTGRTGSAGHAWEDDGDEYVEDDE